MPLRPEDVGRDPRYGGYAAQEKAGQSCPQESWQEIFRGLTKIVHSPAFVELMV
jgi:hypothetical protein